MPRFVTTIGLPLTLKERLDDLAKEENRSTNNLIVTILRDYAREKDEEEGKERADYVE